MEDEQTQPATQPLPGHEGNAPSSINNNYLSGVICLLHPSSPAAYAAVERLSKVEPTHVFKTPDIPPARTPNAGGGDGGGGGAGDRDVDSGDDDDELSTQLAAPVQFYSEDGLDIALRSEPGPKEPDVGFVFGRNPFKCDVVICETTKTRRISNQHFRIYRNPNNVLMLEDHSTNGTWVDNIKIGGSPRDHENGITHALFAGSIIVVAPGSSIMRFVVRIPNQSGSGLCPSRTPPTGGYRGAGIDPGLPAPRPPARMAPQIRPAAARSPHKNLAAINRKPGPPEAHQMQAHQMHTSMVVEKDLGWNGGGTYKIEGIIGSGAFATVKRGVLWKTGDVFAIKVIQKRSVTSNASSIKKEVEILEKLNHPHIVSCKESHEDLQNVYIVMEFVGGGDLGDYLKNNTFMREDKVKEVSRQVLRGIEYVHGMGISHRDLKPDNILMVTEDPLVVKISDFGLAKMVQSEDTFLRTFCGTMLYLAPEVYPGYTTAVVAGGNSVKRKRNPREEAGREGGRNDKQKRRYNQAVDMWSFGCVIHMLLTGKPPFEGKNADDMLRIILKGYVNTELLETALGSECHEAKDFIRRLLQVNPAMRMHEQEALQHEWLQDDTSLSSMERDEDEEFERTYNEAAKEVEEAESMLVSGELSENGDMAEKWEKVSGDPVWRSKEKTCTPILEDAPPNMSFDRLDNNMSIGREGDSVNDVFRSLGAESHSSDSVMFRRPPDTSTRGSSGVFPEVGYSMYSTAEESMLLPKNGALAQTKEAFPPDFQFASQVTPGSESRGLYSQGRSISDGSLAAAEAMVGNLKVASPSPRGTPSPNTSSNSDRHNGGGVNSFNASSFDSPAVVYSTPRSLMAPQGSVHPTPSSNTENHAPLSQPCNVQQAEAGNFMKPNSPWGRLVPIPGTISGTTISLGRQITTIGRSPTCTNILQDIRISKTHFAIQLADPALAAQPEDNGTWRPEPNMIAWFKIAGTNGCFLNGRKKRKETIGRIYNGDIIHLFKEEKNGQLEFIGYRCELKTGVHLREQMEVSDSEMTVKQKAEIVAHGVSMGISMATTVAVATFAGKNESVDMV